MRPRLAPGFSVLAGEAGTVWLVAGEDLRFRIGAGAWLVELLRACDGTREVAALAELAPAAQRADVTSLVAQLVAERVLVEATPEQVHAPAAGFSVVGDGAVAEAMRPHATSAPLVAFVQDRLDHGALLAFAVASRAARRRWMWITTGPAQRAWVGPLFVPDAGPCAACLLVHFKRLSPVPDLHDALIARGAETVVAPLSAELVAMVAAVARGKLALAADPVVRPALFALHVIEASELSVSLHVPVRDPECAACGR